MSFEKKVVIVTGAAKGIGKEIAISFAKEKAFVVAADLDEKECASTAKEVNALGGKGIAVKCNVSLKKDVDEMVEKTLKEFGKVDILVNNAGIYPFIPFKDLSEEQWDKVIDVNLKGIFLCSQAAVKKMNAGGKIVNISSIAATMGYASLVHYCASKGGINGFTRALALELAPQKINVNVVAPGATRTPGIGNLDKKLIDGIASTIPWGRIGESLDIANAVLFLASEKADFITGQVLVVDGGSTLK